MISSDEESLISSSSSDYSSSDPESDEDNSLESARIWCAIDLKSPPPAPPRFVFRGAPGLQPSAANCENPVDFFNLFFNDDVVEDIVNETNRYASQYLIANEVTPTSRAQKWTDITRKEMRVYLALVALQGIVKKPVIEWYWSRRPLLSTPLFAKIMTEKKFSLITKFLHFADNEKNNDSVAKLKKIFDISEKLKKNFQAAYVPDRDVCVDESLLGFKGRLGWKQYIPAKRSRFGIKFFTLCESNSGYIWNQTIYTGKDTLFDKDFGNFGLSTQSVLSLVKPLLGQGYLITVDNFYTSPELAEYLRQQDTDLCGTLRVTRKGLPPELKAAKLKKGEVIAFQKGKMCVLKWMDRKAVCMLSTIHNPEMKTISKRSKTVVKPAAVIDYNKNMGGVDLMDQCMSYYKTSRKSKKYYKKIFKYLLGQAFWNAFVLYQKCGGKKVQVEFRLEVIESLIDQNAVDVVNAAQDVVCGPSRLTGRHFVNPVDTRGKKKNAARRCVVCSSKKTGNNKRQRRETRYQCTECDVGLCVYPCFEIYHTVLDFSEVQPFP